MFISEGYHFNWQHVQCWHQEQGFTGSAMEGVWSDGKAEQPILMMEVDASQQPFPLCVIQNKCCFSV